ncbi:flavoprotein [Methanonatronarchaeum sp. AMET6-2]|uniref:flavoprotein n=1 Tax=Methanonatronarchaeum sp. AMET6-2 TaxID=2933293 RepID=UPI001FF6819C|nr:flavoprotein [Methanonatronarchaeum sp. AMET6-2]UOY09841.1 4Fe-4S binding protein [Methanonatronarchaeum sp. AMET6-2]
MDDGAIGWCITGAGALLEKSIDAAERVSRSRRITFFVSEAGEEVLEMYGLMERLLDIVSDAYLDEVFFESDSGCSFQETGRFMIGRYSALVVSPATSNTVGKMANGISDTIVTNCFSHATKTGVKTVVVPVDLAPDISFTPHYVSREDCVRCERCKASEGCPEGAIERYKIDYRLCSGCGRCVELCPEDAVKCRKIDVFERNIDKANFERLKQTRNLVLLSDPLEVQGEL